MSERLRIGVNGAAGRMGQRVVALSHRDAELQVVAAIDAATSPLLNSDAGELAGIGTIGVPVKADVHGSLDVVIDFSTPAGLVSIARVCADRQIPLVAATTGLSPEQR